MAKKPGPKSKIAKATATHSSADPFRDDKQSARPPAQPRETYRGKFAVQQFQLMQLFSSHPNKVWTSIELAQAFEGTDAPEERHVKAIKRILENMLEFDWPIQAVDAKGVPVKTEKGKRSNAKRYFKYLPKSLVAQQLEEIFKDGFNEIEAFCLILAQSQIDAAAVPNTKAVVSPMLQKIIQSLPKKVVDAARSLHEHWSLPKVIESTYTDRYQDIRVWQFASAERCKVRLRYQTPGKQERDHVVAPVGFRVDTVNNAILLLAAKEISSEHATWKPVVPWKLDRCIELEVLTSEPKCPGITKLLQSSIMDSEAPNLMLGIDLLYANSSRCFYRIGEPWIDVEIVITKPRWIQFALEKKIHPNQKVEGDPASGQLTLKIEKCQASDILNRLMPVAPWFEIKGPESFRQHVQLVAQRLLDSHV
jgi:hypothetical protein